MEHKKHKEKISKMIINYEIATLHGNRSNTPAAHKRFAEIVHEVKIYFKNYGEYPIPDTPREEEIISFVKNNKMRGRKPDKEKWEKAYQKMRTRLKHHRHKHEDKNGKLSRNSLFKQIAKETGFAVKTFHNNIKDFPDDIKNLMK